MFQIFPGEVFVLGTSQKTSINNLIKFLNTKYNRSITPNYLPSRDGDIKESVCNNDKIKKNIGYNRIY